MMNPFKYIYNAFKDKFQRSSSTTVSDVVSHTNSVLPVMPQSGLIVAMGDEEDTNVERGKSINVEAVLPWFEGVKRIGDFLQGLCIMLIFCKEFLSFGEWIWDAGNGFGGHYRKD